MALQPASESSTATVQQPMITGLRGVAALMIVLSHVSWATSPDEGFVRGLFARADSGVAIFFALSGFLLCRPWVLARQHSQTSPDVRRYARHRMFRILPAYWIVLAVALLTTRTPLTRW